MTLVSHEILLRPGGISVAGIVSVTLEFPAMGPSVAKPRTEHKTLNNRMLHHREDGDFNI